MMDGSGCQFDAHEYSGRLFSAFSSASAIGLAIFDRERRYRACNRALAEINGLPAREHLGYSVRDIFADHIDLLIAPAFRQVLATGRPVAAFELNAILPTRNEIGKFMDYYFPVDPSARKIDRVGLLVVEVTSQRQLVNCIRQIFSAPHQPARAEQLCLARELHDSIDQYHAALAISLDELGRKPVKSIEKFAESVAVLDARILAMRKLVSSVATRFRTEVLSHS